ncbi:MAG: hypothetical protein IKD23_01035 [Lentisphaeria bacterium]|nr:LamG domain-containing protein [Lentisphaerota bacterium]MBR2624961.1 hypothetical protein [Lentisphaeria bacterium]
MKKLLLFAAVSGAAALTAAGNSVPAYPLCYKDVTFHVNFDGTADAAMSQGRAKPIQTHGKVEFRDGLRGKALFCGQGGAMFLYMRNKNMDLTKPGTLLFFYKPLNWEKSKFKGGSFFCGIQATKGALYFNVAHDPVNACPCRRPVTLNFFNGVKIPSQMYAYYPNFPQSDCEKWHMLAFSWEPGKLQISQDGRAWKEYPVAFTITAEDFPNPAICIGESSKWNYLLDEFTVYNRVLTSGEIAEIYNDTITK